MHRQYKTVRHAWTEPRIHRSRQKNLPNILRGRVNPSFTVHRDTVRIIPVSGFDSEISNELAHDCVKRLLRLV